MSLFKIRELSLGIFQELESFVFPTGKWKGKTLREISKRGGDDYLIWFSGTYGLGIESLSSIIDSYELLKTDKGWVEEFRSLRQ